MGRLKRPSAGPLQNLRMLDEGVEDREAHADCIGTQRCKGRWIDGAAVAIGKIRHLHQDTGVSKCRPPSGPVRGEDGDTGRLADSHCRSEPGRIETARQRFPRDPIAAMQCRRRERQVGGDHREQGELECNQSDCGFQSRESRRTTREISAIPQGKARRGGGQCYFRVKDMREFGSDFMRRA
jgi:hypothetical protein